MCSFKKEFLLQQSQLFSQALLLKLSFVCTICLTNAKVFLLMSSIHVLQVFSSAENRILGYVVAGGIITFALFYFVLKRR
jgi:hypothetical protein